MIISIINQKGGTGKTTVAVNLALAFLLDGYNVLVIDADKQGTATQFRDYRRGLDKKQFPMVQISTPTIQQDVPKFNFDIIIIDAGGYDNKTFRGCMVVSDLIIVPCQPSGADLWSTETTFKILEEAREYNLKFKVYGLLNMIDSKTKVLKDIPDVVKDWKEQFNVEFFNTSLTAKVQYQYTFTDGLGIMEQKVDKAAVAEFMNFFAEVKDAVKAK